MELVVESMNDEGLSTYFYPFLNKLVHKDWLVRNYSMLSFLFTNFHMCVIGLLPEHLLPPCCISDLNDLVARCKMIYLHSFFVYVKTRRLWCVGWQPKVWIDGRVC